MNKQELKKEMKNALAESKAAQNTAIAFLSKGGEELKLDEWVTIKEYAKRYNLAGTHIVTNWIRRGVIPTENVRVITELNNIRLVKAIPYKE